MNIDNRYSVSASLFMLKEIKNREQNVNKAYQLLRRKADAIRIRGRQAALELSTTQAILGHVLREAYMSLAAIKFTNGESNALVLENIGQAQIRVQRIPENTSGVSTVLLQAVEVPCVGDAMKYAGLAAGGHRTSETKKAFRETLMILLKFASLRNTCLLLNEALQVTQRKLNGIEKVILPKLRNTETYILKELDEREREEFHRLKLVKAKKNVRSRSELAIRKREKHVYCSSGDGGQTSSRRQLKFDAHNHPHNPMPCRYNAHLLPFRLQPTDGVEVQLPHDSGGVPSTSSVFWQESRPCFGDRLPCKKCGGMSTETQRSRYQPICYPPHWEDEDLLF